MFLNTGLYSCTLHTNAYDGDYRMKLNINDMPSEVNELPKKYRDYAILLANDGLIDEWVEVFDAINECDLQTHEEEYLR
jgi:hypothetical protein